MEPREFEEQPLYNSRLVRNFIRLIKARYAHIDIDDLLEYAGIKIFQVDDDGHWFTQQQVNRFYERVVQLTGQKDIAREAGVYSASPDNLGPLQSYLLGLMGLARVFELMGTWTKKLSRSSDYRPRIIGPNKVEITVTPNEGVHEEPFQCENRIGYVEGFSRLFNVKPPKVEHPECLFRNGTVCRYLITWQESSSNRWRRARNTVVPALGAACLLAPSLFTFRQTVSIILPLALIVGLVISWIAERITTRELRSALDEVSAASEERMERISVNYDNSLLINEIGQALSAESDIDGVLEKISPILQKRLDHDRGMFLLANREKSRLLIRSAYGYTSEQLAKLKEFPFRLDDPGSGGFFSAAFHGKRPGVFSDLDAAKVELTACDAAYARATDSRSLICCPIVYEEEPLGVLVEDHFTRKRPLRQSDINLLMGIASQIGSRIHNILLEDQLRQVQKMDAVGSLAGGVAHDFNNILSAILGYSEMIIRKLPQDHPLLGNAKIIYQSGERAAALTRQLLAFSRRQVLEMKVNNLNTIVEDLSRMLGRLIGDDIVMELRTGTPLGNIMADVGQVGQVLMNLSVNARDAMPDGGRLTIETGETVLDERYAQSHSGVQPGAYAVLTVTDTGVGMIPAVRERIFEPFFTTKGAGKGTGLGLSTVYGIVKQHNGHISVYSEPGRGTTFKIFFPLVSAHVEETAVKETKALVGGTETIMVVDDDASIRRLVIDTLEPLGYKLLNAACGEDALRISKTTAGTIDLLVSDVVMPGMNGRQLINALRNGRPGIKAILMSGYPDNVVVRSGDLEPGVVFINKPFPPIQLTDKIRSLLDEVMPGTDLNEQR